MRLARTKGDGVPSSDCPDLYRDRALKGARSAKARASVYMIEGESLTYVQMAARLGCSVDAVKNRMDCARKRKRTITWVELSR